MSKGLSPVSRTLLSIGILAAGVVGFILMGKEEVEKRPPPKSLPPLVTTISAIAHQDGLSFDVDGVVVPFREINLAAEVAGRVDYKSPNCRVGRVVKKGEVLLGVEKRDYELEVRRLEEELAQADSMIQELIAEIKSVDNQVSATEEQQAIDKAVLDRNLRLFESRAASTVEVDTARRTELATRIAMQTLRDQKNLLVKRQARMESAKKLVEAGLDKANLNLTRVSIVSPIDGVVVSENVQEGGYVQTGATMIVIQETSQMDVSCKIYMRQMQWLWKQPRQEFTGQTVEREGDSLGAEIAGIPNADAEIPALPGGHDFPDTPAQVIYELMGARYVWNGVVDRYDGGGIDSQTRMVPCRVHVKEPTQVSLLNEDESTDGSALFSGENALEFNGDSGPPTLLTGMFVKVRIHAQPKIDLIRLPHSAIQPGGKVWLVSEGKLKEQEVEVATSTRDGVIAYQRGELVPGSAVVTSPLAAPREGMDVMQEVDDPRKSTGAERGKVARRSEAGEPTKNASTAAKGARP